MENVKHPSPKSQNISRKAYLPEKSTWFPAKPTGFPEKPTWFPEIPSGFPEKPTWISDKQMKVYPVSRKVYLVPELDICNFFRMSKGVFANSKSMVSLKIYLES